MDWDAAIAIEARGKKGPPCSIGLALEAMDPVLRGKVEQSIQDPMVKGAHISRALGHLDPPVNVSGSTVQRHRNGECACGVG